MKIKNAKVFIDGEFKDVEVQFQNGVITKIANEIDDHDVIDGKGNYLYAGGVETHMHGGFLYSFYDNSQVDFAGHGEEHVREICKRLPQYGVTSVLATLGADSSLANLTYAVRCIRNARKNIVGADPFKLHFEGPYTNPDQHCCYNPEFTALPTKEHTMAMTDKDLSDVMLINVAPEVPGAMEWIEWVSAQGVKTEVCYTHCSSDLVREAADHGLDQTSHLYNCFQPMHHRINGPVIGSLLDDRIKVQLTCDNYHVASDWIKLAIRLKGIENCYGITDMTSLAGLGEGLHENVPYYGKIMVTNGIIREMDGTICGGSNTWHEIMKICRDEVGLTMEEVGSLYCESPARCLDIKDRGKIEVGRRADFVIMDYDYNVLQTLIKGETYYKAS